MQRDHRYLMEQLTHAIHSARRTGGDEFVLPVDVLKTRWDTST